MNEAKPYDNEGLALLVEGKDEIGFFGAILKQMGVTDAVWIGDVGGKDQFPAKLPAALNIPGFRQNCRAYAIIRDADLSADASFDSIKGLLAKFSQPVPSQRGIFTVGTVPRVGVYIMPGNSETGMLESLCMQSVADHAIIPCIDAFMQCVEVVAGPPSNPHKFRAKSFLAARSSADAKDCPSVGIAAQRGYWSLDHACMTDLRNFLRQLRA